MCQPEMRSYELRLQKGNGLSQVQLLAVPLMIRMIAHAKL